MVSEEDIQELIGALRLSRSSYNLRRRAAEALEDLGESVVVPLIEALDHNDWEFTCRVINVLRKINDSRAIVPLLELLNVPNLGLRSCASTTISDIGEMVGLDKMKEIIQNYVSRESAKGKENGKKAMKNATRALKIIIVWRSTDQRTEMDKGKLSEGKPRAPNGIKGRILRSQRRVTHV